MRQAHLRACTGAVAVVVALLLGPAFAVARAPSTPHRVHGLQRVVCHAGAIEAWPGGARLARVPRGARLHFYSVLDGYALVTRSTPRLERGYLRLGSLCPLDAHHHALIDRDVSAAAPDHPHASVPLPTARTVRICASSTWLRDVPLNRPKRLLLLGDSFVARAHSHSGWLGGHGYGHANLDGWIPITAVCSGLTAATAHEHPRTVGTATVLAPEQALPCTTRRIVVGVRAGTFTASLSGDPAPRYGEPRLDGSGRGWDLAALGPVRCHGRYTLTYTGVGPGAATIAIAFTVGRPPSAAGARATAAAAGPRADAASACDAPAGRAYAHSRNPPIEHHYHSRPAIDGDGGRIAYVAVHGGRSLQLAAGGRPRVVAPPPRTFLAEPALSADGRTLAAQAVGHGGREIVLVRAGRSRVVAATGANPSLDADGGEVAFEGPGGIYVASGSAPARLVLAGGGFRPALSGDGRFVVAEVRDPAAGWQIERVDLRSRATVLVSQAAVGGPARGDSLAATIDADGGRVAFQSTATDVLPGLRRTLRNIFVRVIASARTVLVSANRCGGPADGYSRYASISADGRVVAFDSHARNLVAGDTRGEGNIFVRDLATGTTRLASGRPDGRPSTLTSFSPALAPNGRSVAFASYAADLTRRPPPHGPGIRVYVTSTRGQGTRFLGAAGAEASAARAEPGPLGVRVDVPRLSGSCATATRVATAITLSAAAIARPVRLVRILLQPLGNEHVITKVELPPVARRQQAQLTVRGCRRVFLRYELLLGRIPRPHDHTSVRFMIDTTKATARLYPERPE